MSLGEKKDPFLSSIEKALDPGRSITYKASWSFVNRLDDVKAELDNLMEQGDAVRVVRLYELFIAGSYEKMEEIDDSSGNMGMFFDDLFCSWVIARQRAGLDPKETVNQMLKIMDNDDYGVCYEVETDLVTILGKAEMLYFEETIYHRFEKSFSQEKGHEKTIYDFSYKVRKNADILKEIYVNAKKTKVYIDLCEKIGITPKDCEVIADIYKSDGQYEKALYFADKGLSLGQERSWPNYGSSGLPNLKRELLNILGREEEALQTAWQEFKNVPSEYSYEELMKYVSKKDREAWHRKAVSIAQKKSLCSGLIEFFIKTKEINVLSEKILSARHDELESLGYYALNDAAKKLSEKHYAAAAKIYRAMGMEIINKGKSKHYKYALSNFEKAKKLYGKTDLEKEWLSTVEIIRGNHSRKYSFIEDFEDVVAVKSI